jgi:hypothetical protein
MDDIYGKIAEEDDEDEGEFSLNDTYVIAVHITVFSIY